MLITRVQEKDNGGSGEGAAGMSTVGQPSRPDYQTASELFEMMAKTHGLNRNDDTLTTRDLVILYKNIDLGTKLMSNANNLKKRPNQYVETVIYNDEPESDASDVSEICSREDLHDVFAINEERLNLIDNGSCFENTLCHKLGDLKIQSSNLDTDYDRYFLFKDPYIKDQLKSMDLMSNFNNFYNPVFPTSLLDYICCKRLEDNYNFYMESAVIYVQHTIEQLKRISNGDYMTDKAKQKWREVKSGVEIVKKEDFRNKVLSTSTSIPLHVVRKTTGHKSTWDDIVHSEVDIRSLSKILEKKIVLEIPKLLCGSYRLFSKRRVDNLLLSCKKDKKTETVEDKEEDSRVDVVVQLKSANSGNLISNIDSIMILQTVPASIQQVPYAVEALPLTFKKVETTNSKEILNTKGIDIIELDDSNNNNEDLKFCDDDVKLQSNLEYEFESIDKQEYNENNNLKVELERNPINNNMSNLKENSKQLNYNNFKDAFRESRTIYNVRPETTCSLITPDDLRLTMHRLNKQISLPEENTGDFISQSTTTTKKKSPTRPRIKSPYENESHIIEDKKRRKLLEIRDQREKKKMALSENCKITKHKYNKCGASAQPANSVTKLSITNKSFYNSIYGQTMEVDNKQSKIKIRKGHKKENNLCLQLDQSEDDYEEKGATVLTPDMNSKKYVNRSYYLDDAVTEMMRIKQEESKDLKETCSASTSAASNDFRTNLNLLSQLIGHSTTDLSSKDDVHGFVNKPDEMVGNQCESEYLSAPRSNLHTVPSNTPKDTINDKSEKDTQKCTTSITCRKSIEKIYDLMKKLGKLDETEGKNNNMVDTERINVIGRRGSSSVQYTDSGTSLKHHPISSNPSSFSFDKSNMETLNSKIVNKKNPETPTTVQPKVIISSKLHTSKMDYDRLRRDRKRPVCRSPLKTVPDNPLKAISQLLHEFDNVQKTKQKTDTKFGKKLDINSADGKSMSRQGSSKRRSRLEQHLKDCDQTREKLVKSVSYKEKKPRPLPVTDLSKLSHENSIEEKFTEKNSKKKIADLIDEVREARGEAVRGPPKLFSRLYTLAQPKRSYVQAHSKEYQNRYGKNVVADRLQRMAAATAGSDRNTGPVAFRGKLRRGGTEMNSSVCVRQPAPPVPPLERAARLHRSASTSPTGKKNLTPQNEPSFNHTNVSDIPDTIKSKMVAVESYVKSHYGRVPPTEPSELMQGTHKSRVPFIPHDIELASMSSSPLPEESSIIGNKLHAIIDSMIKTRSPALTILTECNESNSKFSKQDTDLSNSDHMSKLEEPESVDSDYPVDIFGDKNVVTAVEDVPDTTKYEEKIDNENNEEEDNNYGQYEIQPFHSESELEKLENALCRCISTGTFNKRLRIKNFTLTPKQSLQQIFMLQSCDTGSLLLKSKLSKKINASRSDTTSELKTLPMLVKRGSPCIDWNYTNIPMQITTVGYAFPQFGQVEFGSGKTFKSINDFSSRDDDLSLILSKQSRLLNKSNKTCQCFKGGPPRPVKDFTERSDMNGANVEKNFVASKTIHENLHKAEPELFILDQTSEIFGNRDPILKTQEITGKNKNSNTNTPASEHSECIDYTTSLDVLVGLLNEIQTIITCQTNTERDAGGDQQYRELDTILSKAAVSKTHEINTSRDNPKELISITSLDKLRQLETSPSIYSLYLSNDEQLDMNISSVPQICNTYKPEYEDKEVNVNFSEKKYINRYTDVPSMVFPLMTNQSTNVTNSLIGVLSKPSSQSLFSLDYHSISSDIETFNSHMKIIDIPKIDKLTECSIKDSTDPKTDDSELSVVPIKIKTTTTFMRTAKLDTIEHEKSEKVKNMLNIKKSNQKNYYGVKDSDFDRVMKMKRDILVSVYSILVLVVFAAMSFPEFLYRA